MSVVEIEKVHMSDNNKSQMGQSNYLGCQRQQLFRL